MGELKSKHERLKETPGQRIVLAGGSGVAFDCDSEMIDEIFPSYEVVNLACMQDLGRRRSWIFPKRIFVKGIL